MTARRIDANGLSHFVRDDGPETAPAIVLLHGYPDSSAMWSGFAPRLAAGGFRVIAPDLRGFGETDMPARLKDYDIETGAAPDVIAILDALGVERAHLVGHDFGAVVAWTLAIRRPDRFRTLAALSVGHPRAFMTAGAEQIGKSWYIGLHLLPGLAEAVYRLDDWRPFKRYCAGHPDIDAAAELLKRPGRLTAGLNWYRVNANPLRMIKARRSQEDAAVRIPTLGVWSTLDQFLGEAQMKNSREFIAAPWRYARIEGARHWLTHEQPERLVALLFEHWNASEP